MKNIRSVAAQRRPFFPFRGLDTARQPRALFVWLPNASVALYVACDRGNSRSLGLVIIASIEGLSEQSLGRLASETVSNSWASGLLGSYQLGPGLKANHQHPTYHQKRSCAGFQLCRAVGSTPLAWTYPIHRGTTLGGELSTVR